MTLAHVDAGESNWLTLAVLVQYRMATTQQMHRVIAPQARIEQTRRRLATLRDEGLIDRVLLPQAGRSRVWFATRYGRRVASQWSELREWQPAQPVADRTAATRRAGHALAVTETAIAFLNDARRRGDEFRPLDWIRDVRHPLGRSKAVIPHALMYYRNASADGADSLLRAFVDVDRATLGPQRLAAKLTAYARLHPCMPAALESPRPATGHEPPPHERRQRHAPFRRLLFVLDNTGPTGIETRIDALHAASRGPALAGFLHTVPVLAASLADLLPHGPSAPIWRPIQNPDRKVDWMHTPRPPARGKQR